MQMPKGSGLEYLDKVVRRSLKYYSDAFKAQNFRLPDILESIRKQTQLEMPTLDSLKKPVESILRGLNSAVAQFTAKPEKVDYNAVVNTFLPPGAKLLKPQNPENSNEIQFADLDGDGRSELIASYRTYEGVKTLILHKDEVQWYRMAEISSPEFEEIHYRNSADVAGDGRNYLLMGLRSKFNQRTLFAYALDHGNARKIFSKNYGMLELLKSRGGGMRSGKTTFAIWNEESPGIHDIELVSWNGLELEKLDNTRYMAGKVIPYYMRKLQLKQDDATGWYNLASAMIKTGNRPGAERALKIGLSHNPDTHVREKYNELISKF